MGSSVPSALGSSTSRQGTCSPCTTKTGITTTTPLMGQTGKTCADTATMMNTAGESLVTIYGREKRTRRRKSVYNGVVEYFHLHVPYMPEVQSTSTAKGMVKKFIQQGRSLFNARRVLSVREHDKKARTPLAAFFNIPIIPQWKRTHNLSTNACIKRRITLC